MHDLASMSLSRRAGGPYESTTRTLLEVFFVEVAFQQVAHQDVQPILPGFISCSAGSACCSVCQLSKM